MNKHIETKFDPIGQDWGGQTIERNKRRQNPQEDEGFASLSRFKEGHGKGHGGKKANGEEKLKEEKPEKDLVKVEMAGIKDKMIEFLKREFLNAELKFLMGKKILVLDRVISGANFDDTFNDDFIENVVGEAIEKKAIELKKEKNAEVIFKELCYLVEKWFMDKAEEEAKKAREKDRIEKEIKKGEGTAKRSLDDIFYIDKDETEEQRQERVEKTQQETLEMVDRIWGDKILENRDKKKIMEDKKPTKKGEDREPMEPIEEKEAIEKLIWSGGRFESEEEAERLQEKAKEERKTEIQKKIDEFLKRKLLAELPEIEEKLRERLKDNKDYKDLTKEEKKAKIKEIAQKILKDSEEKFKNTEFTR